MVDREARDKLGLLLRRLGSGRISYGEFHESLPVVSRDNGVRQIVRWANDEFVDWAEDICYKLPEGKWEALTALTDGVMTDFSFAGDLALGRKERRHIARAILFLQTDFEHGKEGLTQLTWWQAILLAPVLSAGIFISACVLGWLILIGTWIIFVAPIAAFLVYALCRLAFGIDFRVWPFYRRQHYREALSKPRWLSGRSL
jgi:hypothetical protein